MSRARIPAICALLFLATSLLADDLRLRLGRRFPGCRGTLEGVYAGDEYAMFQRLRVERPKLRLTLLTEKDRGEDWGDLISGGAEYVGGPKDLVAGLSAGWLRADFGSGLVLAHPGSWGGSGYSGYEKAPVLRMRLEPASGGWGSEGRPLTGVGGTFRLGELQLAALQGLSWLDRSGEGLHRTQGEIDGRAWERELMPAVRACWGPLGATAAAAWTRTDSGSADWQRAGLDLQLGKGPFLLSGEAAVSRDSSGTGTAFWAGPSHRTEAFRQTFLVFGAGDGFARQRASLPLGECSIGCRYGLRWRPAVATFLSAGLACRSVEEGDEWRAAGELRRRLARGLEASAGLRWSSEVEEESWRGVTSGSWEPSQLVRLSVKLQLTGWSEGDSSEAGSCAETRLRLRPRRWLTLRLGAAGFSTDGWGSRAYVAALAFPGEFGSKTVQGRGMVLQAAASVEAVEGLFLRGAAGWIRREGQGSLGSGWEETEGDSRTEVSMQLDWSF